MKTNIIKLIMNSCFKFVLKNQHFIILAILIFIALIRNIETIKGLNYGYNFDSDRDLSNVQNLLEGNFGHDPSYLGEYVWYNPLISFIYLIIIKISGLSSTLVLTQSGAYLNILGAISFFFMVKFLFNRNIAIASTASFLFFSTGNLPGCYAATYTPWAYPVCVMQTIFYVAIIVYCKAMLNFRYSFFILAGAITGLAFLGHSAPALLLLLIFCTLYFKQLLYFYRNKTSFLVNKFIIYLIVFSIAFLAISMPFLYYVFGKYNLHMVNYSTYELADPIFSIQGILDLIKQNLSFSFLISLIGLYILFFKSSEKGVKLDIIKQWFYISVLLYTYTTLLPYFHYKFNIIFQGIVPSFHFFFYLKALQSVLFGIGFCVILDKVVKIFKYFRGHIFDHFDSRSSIMIPSVILIISILYYPYYSKRSDFKYRVSALERNAKTEEIEVYNWFLKHTDINDVVVCDVTYASFPVMATGRKMVAASPRNSNPYISYDIRDNERQLIISSILVGNKIMVNDLLAKYKVKYIVLDNEKINKTKGIKLNLGLPVFRNKKISVYKNT